MQSLAVLSASALFADYVKLEGYRRAAVKPGLITLGQGLFH